MARIRSIHPGFFKDESYLACSAFARLLAIGLLTEADDQGIFEWKPITLKVSILPADSIDLAALLTELSLHDIVRRFEHKGRHYGAIRNFKRYQRPKKPRHYNPLPDGLVAYVEGDDRGELGDQITGNGTENDDQQSGEVSPPVPHQFPTRVEKPPQRKEGIGIEESPTTPDVSATTPRTHATADRISKKFIALREEFWPSESGLPAPFLTLQAQAQALLDQGGPEALIIEVLTRNMKSKASMQKGAPTDFGAFKRSLPEAIARHRTAAAGVALLGKSNGTPPPKDHHETITQRDREQRVRREAYFRVRLEQCRAKRQGWNPHWDPLDGANPILLDEFADVVKRSAQRGGHHGP